MLIYILCWRGFSQDRVLIIIHDFVGLMLFYQTGRVPCFNTRMLDRPWILSILAQLPACWWPVFLWDCWQVGRYMRAWGAAHPQGGMVGIGVTRKGRILITWQMPADERSETDWTQHAPRTPWKALDLDALATDFAAFSAPDGICADSGPVLDGFHPPLTPVALEPG